MPQSEKIAEKSIMCLGCSRVVPAGADFCPHCGAPLSSTSTTDPYKSVFAEGQMYWRLTHEPMKPIVMIGFGLLACASLLVSFFALAESLREAGNDLSQRAILIVFFVASLALSFVFWWRVVQNFRRHRKSEHATKDTA